MAMTPGFNPMADMQAKPQVYTGTGANPWQTPGFNPMGDASQVGTITASKGGVMDPMAGGMQTPGINPMGGVVNNMMGGAPAMPMATPMGQPAQPGQPQLDVYTGQQPQTAGPDQAAGGAVDSAAWTPQPLTDLSVDGFKNWVRQTFNGHEATQQELQQVASAIGYQEGQPITPEMMARAQQIAVQMAQQRGWQPPTVGGPTQPGQQPRLTVEDAPVFDAPDLELPTGPRPELNLPTGPRPELNLPDRYTGPGEFRAPTAEEMALDPGYQFRVKQGQMALENAAAAKGLPRSGNHLIDLLGYGQEMASQEYGNIYNRSADAFERNRRTGLDVYGLGREAALDEYGAGLGMYDRDREDAYGRYDADLGLYDRDREDAYGRFDADFRGREAEYAPRYDTWMARNRANELNLEDDWRREVYTGDDAFRRERAREEDRRYNVEDRWRRDVYGDQRRDRMSDEDWRRLMLEEDRRRFLVGTGM